jgi:GNAT superfamily N-acetyltransferase
LHKSARFANDLKIHFKYANATYRSGYYEEFWANVFSQPGTRILKACQGDTILGLAICGRADSYPGITDGRLDAGELHQLYIDPHAKGLGIGRKLYMACRQVLSRAGFTTMYINVLGKPDGTENSDALSFYRHMGAELSGYSFERPKRCGEIHELACPVLVDRNLVALPKPNADRQTYGLKS